MFSGNKLVADPGVENEQLLASATLGVVLIVEGIDWHLLGKTKLRGRSLW